MNDSKIVYCCKFYYGINVIDDVWKTPAISFFLFIYLNILENVHTGVEVGNYWLGSCGSEKLEVIINDVWETPAISFFLLIYILENTHMLWV